MAKSIKTNYILNLINTGSQYLFPLITFPYATRIMGPDGIGLVNFYQSIISYVILIAGLGIPMYGIREIARVRDNNRLLGQTTIEILSIHLGLTIISYLIILILLLFVPQINSNSTLFLLLSLSVLFTTIGCDWFYKGIEDFKYIMILGISVKTVAMIFLFLLVKDRQDILWYGLFCVIGTVGGNIFNLIRLRKFIKISSFSLKEMDFKRHITPIMQIFLFSIITSLYLNMNPVILGFIKDEVAVGYYTTGLKIFSVVTSISGSLAVVMLPRVSYLVAEKKTDELETLTQKAYNFSIGLSLPLCIFLIFISPYVIRILCGDGFDPSIICTQVMSPIIVFLAISSLMGTQILYPMGKIRTINSYCAIGATVDILLSILIVPLLGQLGTSIAYSLTEMTVMILSIIAAKRYLKITYVNKNIAHYLIAALLMVIILYGLSYLNFSYWLMILLMMGGSLIVYTGFLFITKDQITNSILAIIKKSK